MAAYTVKIYKGDYSARQREANRDGAVVYVEQHFNAATNANADYSCAVVADNASRTSKAFGQHYAKLVSDAFGCKIGGDNGLIIGGRGSGNIYHTNMPAVLLEPLFCSNPTRAAEIKSGIGQEMLAGILVDCIRHFFPNGGLVALSIGHKYKTSAPNDRGAAVHGGGTEADYAELVINRVKAMLEQERPTTWGCSE